MTPAQAYQATLERTGDREAALRAGYRAEGRIGTGRAPTSENSRQVGTYAKDALTDPDACRVLAAVNGGARFAREVQRATGLTVAKCRDRLEALARQGHVQRGKVKRAGREWWPVEMGG